MPEAIARQVDDLHPLAEMPELERLDLIGWNSVQDITPLRALRNLKLLRLPTNKIPDLSPVFALPSLAALSVHLPDRNQLTRLSDCEALRSLQVSGIGDAELHALGQLSRLETLEIAGTKADQWAELGKLGASPWLGFRTDAVLWHIEWLAGFNALKWLTLDYCEFDDLVPISNLRELNGFGISGNSVNLLPGFTDGLGTVVGLCIEIPNY